MACDNTIDLNRAEQAVSSLPTDERHDGYESRTLQLHDRTRSVYLPLYPTVSFGPNNQLLLANVPGLYLIRHTYRNSLSSFSLSSLPFSHSSGTAGDCSTSIWSVHFRCLKADE